ncbi:MAG TPA: FtsX-like permease family protein [Vicinamibacterales bacterium]|nr:FtsX-like permease family protein [Vicinamibacterales bacterium]
MPLLDEQLGYYRPALLVLFGAVGLLLVIGVLNVASLLLTRALSREREIAVRVALGASPRQIVRQLLGEGLALSAAGAAVGVVAAALALPLIVRMMPVEIPRLSEAGINVRALGLGLAVVAHHRLLRPGTGVAPRPGPHRGQPQIGRTRQFARCATPLFRAGGR